MKQSTRHSVAAFAALLTGLTVSGCSLLTQEQEAPPLDILTPQVTQREVTRIGRGSIEVRQPLNVTFGAEQQISLYFRQNGRIALLRVGLGQQVAAGQLLAELEAGPLPYDLATAEIDQKRAQLDLDKAKSRVGFANGPDSWELQRLQLALDQANLRLQRQQELLDEKRLLAPFDGTILSVGAAEGDMVEAYKEMLVLSGGGGMLARAVVDSATAARLQPGQTVELFPNDGNSQPVLASVATVPPAASSTKERVVTIRPKQAGDRLQIGRNGKAEVVLETKTNVLLVPVSAIRTFGGRRFVTVVQGDTRKEVAITTGLENQTHAEVLDGLQEGDQVVSR